MTAEDQDKNVSAQPEKPAQADAAKTDAPNTDPAATPDFMAMLNNYDPRQMDFSTMMNLAQQIMNSGHADAFVAQARAAGLQVPAGMEAMAAQYSAAPDTTDEDVEDEDEDEDDFEDEDEDEDEDEGEDDEEYEDEDEDGTDRPVALAQAGSFTGATLPPGMANLMNSPIMSQAMRAMGGNPAMFGGRIQQARMFQSMGQYDQAVEMYLDSIDATPDDPAAYIGIGQSLLMLDRPKDAETFLRKAVELAPYAPDAHIYLGYATYNQGKYPDTLIHFKQARDLDPENAVALNNYGYALFLNKQLEEADPVFVKAGDRGNERAYYNLGLIRFLMRRDADAQQAYADAFELDPRLNEVAGHLEDIDRARDIYADHKEAIDKAEAMVREQYQEDEGEE